MQPKHRQTPWSWWRQLWSRWRQLPQSGRRVAFTAAGLAALLVTGVGAWQVWRAEQAPASAPSLSQAVVGSTAPPQIPAGLTPLSRSAPVKISIASIKLRAWVDQLGLAADGTMAEQPFARANRAAWYNLGPAPGQLGPAVIVGHVDTKSAIAVFFYLHRLHPGDQVIITRADGHTVTFTVDWLGSYPKTHFPTKLVYGPTNYPALRLITCGGRFDRTDGSYVNNIIVFAHLTAET